MAYEPPAGFPLQLAASLHNTHVTGRDPGLCTSSSSDMVPLLTTQHQEFHPVTGKYPPAHLSIPMISPSIELHPIGYVRSPYKTRHDAPRQGRLSETISEIEILEKYRPALWQIEGRKHLWVLCWFDRADRTVLRATPPGAKEEKGVFAIRSPDRPNPVSLCMVDLLDVHDSVLNVRGLDALDGTPVIDIRVFSPEVDCPKDR
jgi:tRNA (adenine37-N6)-methyltransferase